MKNLTEFHEHVLACYPQEACGYVIDDIFYPVENSSTNPVDCFSFSEKYTFTLLGKDYSIVHSHTAETFTDDPRIPSYEDMKSQQISEKEWGIVHCDGENISEILWFGKPKTDSYEGRKYISNVFDCFTLARDFIFTEFNFDVGTHPRPADWQSWNPHYIEKTYATLGFKEVKEPKFGDILLFCIGSTKPNHIGIFIEENRFLHHLYQRTSGYDTLQKWNKCLVKIIRLEK